MNRRTDARTHGRTAGRLLFGASVRRCVGAFVVVCVIACGRAQWQEADAKLNDAARAARGAGYTPLSGPHNSFGSFTAGGVTSWRVHLEAHQPYFIAAACTTGCDTLNFSINEPHGAEIGADTTAGATPRLAFTAPEEGDYAIVFRYTRCKAEKCRWVAQIYGRPSR